MKNHYTKQTSSQGLRTLLFTLLSCFFAISAQAQDESTLVDFGEMTLDKTYNIKGDFKDYKGSFVAPESGTLTGTGSFSCLLLPYTDQECLTAADYTHSYLQDGEAFTLNVEKGEKYYLFLGFSMSDGTFKMTMSQDNSIQFVSATPENGSIFDLSEGGLVSVQFNKPVAISSAMISCNQTMTEVDYTLQNENIVFDIKNRIYDLMKNGNLKAGDQFGLVMDGVHTAGDEKAILGEDGSLVLTYTLAEIPVALDSTVNVENNPFLSYWMADNDKGIITLIFNGELQSTKERAEAGVAVISCGELESGVGGYYQEEVPYSVNGKELTLNLTGKLRRHSDMLSADMPLEIITIKVKDIRGANGKLAYFPGKGGLGSYTFDMPYQEVKADPTSDFTPGAGSELNDVESIEIWVSDYKTIQHDGVMFSFGQDSVVVTDFEAIPDADFEDAYILNVKVPAEVKAAKGDVTVSFLNLKCIDGLDHSQELSVTYSTATGIENMITGQQKNQIYHLNGKKANVKQLHQLPNGVYIVNGKKVIVCKK